MNKDYLQHLLIYVYYILFHLLIHTVISYINTDVIWLTHTDEYLFQKY